MENSIDFLQARVKALEIENAKLKETNEKAPEMLEMLKKVLSKIPIGAMLEEKNEIKQLIKEATELTK
jgi:predicted nuclease with TOPRIM domain